MSTAETSTIRDEAVRRHQAGRHAEAVAGYRRLLQADPYQAEVYVNIGISLRAQGRLAEAVACYKQAVHLKPEFVEAHYNLANALKEQGRYAEAIDSYTQAVRLKPDFAQAYYNLANAQRLSGRREEAIESYRDAIRVKSDYAAAHVNLAMTLKESGRIAEAVENFAQVVRLDPESAESHNNLGIALKESGRLDEAIRSYAEAIRLRPGHAEAHNNMAIGLHAQGEHDKALESFQRAIQLSPEYAQAHWNRSLVLLLKGRFKEGWKEYRWRRKTNLAVFAYRHEFDRPLWQGRSFVGQRLLAHYEQGLGDNLQFVRYMPMVKQRGGTVIFETPKPLYRLLRNFDGIDELVEALPDAPPNVEFDTCVSLMDLPGIFGTTLETIPAEVPYIHADPDKVKYWRDRLAGPSFKVGLVWAGRPTAPDEVLSLQHRSCALGHFAPLADVPGVTLYGLQKGPAAAQMDKLATQIIVSNLGEHFEDFTDTAGAIENLDLVISIDTSVAHLAGAMGKPVWLLLKTDADWRWLLERQDSPWYPTMRLFRQKKAGDWGDVLRRVADELRARVRSGTGILPVCFTGFSPVEEDRSIGHDTPAPHGQSLPRASRGDAHATARPLLTHVLRKRVIMDTENATQHHQNGSVDQTDLMYQHVLRKQPKHPVALHSQGALAYQRGQYEEAVDLVGRAIAADPSVPQFYNTLGVLLEAQGKADLAIDAYRQAVSLKPDYTEAYNNMAIALQSRGDYAEAVKVCHKTLSLDPDYAEAYNAMGYALQMQGELDRAREAYARATQLKPDFAEAYNHLGVVLSKQERHKEAAESYQQALSINPEYAEVHNNLSIALKGLGELDAAIASCRRALAIDPNFAEAYFNLANAMRDQASVARASRPCVSRPSRPCYLEQGQDALATGRHDEALFNYDRALRIHPDYAEAYNNKAILLNDLACCDEAMTSCERAIGLKPDYAEAHNNLGIILRNKGLLREAAASYRRAIELEPDSCEAHYNLGNALKEQGHCDEAIECYDRAIRIKPGYAQAHWNRSHAFLLSGNLQKGWEGYEWRRAPELEIFTYPHRHEQPRWDGSAFVGRRLLVHCEQGLGDGIQFMRYLPMVKARGGTVIFEAWKPLHGLLQGCAYIDELLELSFEKKTDVNFDLRISLMDLPAVFGTTLETIPAEVPYIRPDREKVEYWRSRLSGDIFRVGIVWAGSPSHGNDHNRSCSPELFAPLADIDGVKLYGLQKGPAAAEIKRLSQVTEIESLSEDLHEFSDTAAVVESLDLVISVDTAPAHLAGAIARPTWVLLPFAPDWRWMLDRTDSPWYPTARLFRQKAWGDWKPVLARVTEELRLLARNSNPKSEI